MLSGAPSKSAATSPPTADGPQPMAPAAAPAEARPRATQDYPGFGPEPAPPTVPPVLQGVGRGAAEAVGFLPDLASWGTNLLLAGADKASQFAGGPSINYRFPNLSDQLRAAGQNVTEAAGYATTKPEDMSPAQELGYNTARFGTQAAVSLPGMVRMAGARAADLAAGGAPKLRDALLRPYMGEGITRPLVGDAAATAGTAAGITAADQNISRDNPVVTPLAGMAGGMSAAGLASMLEGIARGAARVAGKPFGANIDTEINSLPRPEGFRDLDTPAVTKNVADRAATALRAQAVNPDEAAARLGINMAELQPYLDTLPSPARMTQDPGIVAFESGIGLNGRRGQMVARDREFRSGVRDTIDQVAPENATSQPLIDKAKAEAEARISQAQSEADRAQSYVDRTETVRTQHGNELAPYANEGAKVDASRRLDKAVVDEGYVPARAEKNRQFEQAPGREHQLPADDVFAAIDRVRARINDLSPNQQMPNDFVRRIDELRPRIDPDTGENIGGPGTARGGDLADTRKYLSDAENRARNSGNFDLADSIRDLRNAVNRTIEEAPGYAEANANYQKFADTYRPIRGDQAAGFTQDVDRNPQRGGLAAPEQTAGRFLDSGSPRDTQDLTRMSAASQTPAAAEKATRDYLMADLATKGVLDQKTGFIRPDRLRKWMDGRGDFNDLPESFRNEVTAMLAKAQKGERLSGQFAKELEAAQANVEKTQSDIDKGALGLVINSDPDKTVAAVMNNPNRSGKMLDELIRVTDSDPQARDGLKAAVRDFLVDKATTTASQELKPGDVRGPVSPTKLSQVFAEHEREMARIFSPEEMNTLRAGHKALELNKEANVRVTTGSDTIEKMGLFDRARNTDMGRAAEAVLRLKMGALKAGGVLASLNRATGGYVGREAAEANALLERAVFDPELMGLLLGRKVPVGSPAWNSRVNKWLNVGEGARDFNDSQREKAGLPTE